MERGSRYSTMSIYIGRPCSAGWVKSDYFPKRSADTVYLSDTDIRACIGAPIDGEAEVTNPSPLGKAGGSVAQPEARPAARPPGSGGEGSGAAQPAPPPPRYGAVSPPFRKNTIFSDAGFKAAHSITPCTPDGSCFFHALSRGLYNNERSTIQLKQEIADRMTPGDFDMYVESYRANMGNRQPTNWNNFAKWKREWPFNNEWAVSGVHMLAERYIRDLENIEVWNLSNNRILARAAHEGEGAAAVRTRVMFLHLATDEMEEGTHFDIISYAPPGGAASYIHEKANIQGLLQKLEDKRAEDDEAERLARATAATGRLGATSAGGGGALTAAQMEANVKSYVKGKGGGFAYGDDSDNYDSEGRPWSDYSDYERASDDDSEYEPD